MLEVTGVELQHNASSTDLLNAHVERLRTYGQLEDAMHVAADLPDSGRQIVAQRGERRGAENHE